MNRKEIGKLAKAYWMDRLEMAEPKYCANNSWDYFLTGFTFGVEHPKPDPRDELIRVYEAHLEEMRRLEIYNFDNRLNYQTIIRNKIATALAQGAEIKKRMEEG